MLGAAFCIDKYMHAAGFVSSSSQLPPPVGIVKVIIGQVWNNLAKELWGITLHSKGQWLIRDFCAAGELIILPSFQPNQS